MANVVYYQMKDRKNLLVQPFASAATQSSSTYSRRVAFLGIKVVTAKAILFTTPEGNEFWAPLSAIQTNEQYYCENHEGVDYYPYSFAPWLASKLPIIFQDIAERRSFVINN